MRYRNMKCESRCRKGVVLLIVMAMLALFASVAIGFVFYADAEAYAARVNRDALAPDQADIDPEVLASYFLNQLIYGTNNPYSSIRGWELARSIYGYNPAALNHIPYNGVGRSALSYDVFFGTTKLDNANLVNYTLYDGDTLRTPEFYGKQGDPAYQYVGGAN